jgi:hypothetical protein
MRADDLLGTLAARGVAVTRRGAKLHITGRTSAVTQAEWARLRDFKGEILAALPDGDPDAGGAGQFWAAHPGAAAADPRWPELIPLDADERPAFPLEALLVDALADHARAVAFTHQVPVDYPALLDVGVCSGALAGKAEVWVGDTFLEPLNGHFAVFGQTGERKGPPFREATAPVREWERERAEATKAERIKARNAYDVEEERIADLKRRAGKEDDPTRRAKLLAAVDEIESDRTALIPEPVLIADDVTPEKLAMLLAD